MVPNFTITTDTIVAPSTDAHGCELCAADVSYDFRFLSSTLSPVAAISANASAADAVDISSAGDTEDQCAPQGLVNGAFAVQEGGGIYIPDARQLLGTDYSFRVVMQMETVPRYARMFTVDFGNDNGVYLHDGLVRPYPRDSAPALNVSDGKVHSLVFSVSSERRTLSAYLDDGSANYTWTYEQDDANFDMFTLHDGAISFFNDEGIVCNRDGEHAFVQLHVLQLWNRSITGDEVRDMFNGQCGSTTAPACPVLHPAVQRTQAFERNASVEVDIVAPQLPVDFAYGQLLPVEFHRVGSAYVVAQSGAADAGTTGSDDAQLLGCGLCRAYAAFDFRFPHSNLSAVTRVSRGVTDDVAVVDIAAVGIAAEGESCSTDQGLTGVDFAFVKHNGLYVSNLSALEGQSWSLRLVFSLDSVDDWHRLFTFHGAQETGFYVSYGRLRPYPYGLHPDEEDYEPLVAGVLYDMVFVMTPADRRATAYVSGGGVQRRILSWVFDDDDFAWFMPTPVHTNLLLFKNDGAFCCEGYDNTQGRLHIVQVRTLGCNHTHVLPCWAVHHDVVRPCADGMFTCDIVHAQQNGECVHNQ